jgi:hypothetical protein
MNRPFVAAALALALAPLAGCGGDAGAETPPSEASAGDEAPPPLDWAMLVPIETEGLIRLDLARLRRSPHRASIEPLFDDVASELGEGELQRSFSSLLDRTDLILLAMLPERPGRSREVVVLARGDYAADEIERLDAASDAPGQSEAVDVRGQRVWVDRSGRDPVAFSQIRPGTLALTSSLERMDRLLARTRMAAGGPRWPPAVRELVERAALDEATLSLAVARDGLGAGPEGLSMSIAGRADVDGPLDVQVRLGFENPAMATAAAVVFEGMVQQLSRAPQAGSFALSRLASLARVEARGDQVVGTLHADEATAARLVPALVGLLSGGGAQDGEDAPEGEGAPDGTDADPAPRTPRAPTPL